MLITKRVVLAPALAVAFTGLAAIPAAATADPLSSEAVGVLAVASCQLDPEAPLTLEELAPVVVAESDVEVVPGEITAHIVSAEVNTVLGDVQECTFGVLHRDAQLSRVQYTGTAVLSLGDGLGGTAYEAVTEVEVGNMGRGSIDPTTEVPLAGFVAPLESVVEDPAYAVSLDRKSIQVVQIATSRAQKDHAAKLLRATVKASAKLEKKQLKAAAHRHAGKKAAAAQKAHDKRVAAAQARYQRAIAPKTVSRPVSVNHTVTGNVTAAG